MRKFSFLAAALLAVAPVFAADTFKVDPVHSSVVFAAHHAGAGYTYGRFNKFTGTFTIDKEDLAKSTLEAEVTVGSVDTGNEKRDGHLASADWFNAKQYPTITFKSTKVEKTDDTTLSVTGDLTLHGVTKSVTVPLRLTGTGEFPAGTVRSGVLSEFTVKMSEFGIKGMPGAVGDEIKLIVSLEGTK